VAYRAVVGPLLAVGKKAGGQFAHPAVIDDTLAALALAAARLIAAVADRQVLLLIIASHG